MADKKIIVPHGSRISVKIPVERAPVKATRPARATRRGALQPSDADEDLYAFRKGGITFYDLGTRKVGETDAYEYVSFPTFLHEDFTDFEGLRTSYHTAILAGDFTAKDARLKLKQESEFLFLDAVFKKDDQTKRFLIGNKDKRAYLKDFPEEGGPTPANVTETSFKSGTLKFKSSGWKMAVESAWFYNNFDTGDADNFKVTEDSDPTSAPVEFTTGSKPMRVYLTPRLVYNASDEDGQFRFYMARLAPVLPDFSLVNNLSLGGIFQHDQTAEATASDDFWAAIADHWNSIIPGGFPPFFNIFDAASVFHLAGETGAPTLAAVIVKGDKKFYVWRKASADSLPWSFSSIINPNPE